MYEHNRHLIACSAEKKAQNKIIQFFGTILYFQKKKLNKTKSFTNEKKNSASFSENIKNAFDFWAFYIIF